MSSVQDRVLKVIDKQLNKDTSKLKMDSKIREDLGADSLDIVELVMAFEEEFKIEIKDTEAEKISTIQDAVDYIEKTLSKTE